MNKTNKSMQTAAAAPPAGEKSCVVVSDELGGYENQDAVDLSCAPYTYYWAYGEEELRELWEKAASGQPVAETSHPMFDGNIIGELRLVVGDFMTQLSAHISMINMIESKEYAGIEELGDKLRTLAGEIKENNNSIAKTKKHWLMP